MDLESREEKQDRIRQLRDAISQLEAELERELEHQQHRAIDDLDHYFNAVETELASLRSFWRALKEEWKSRRS
jgi:DNA repair exonuclease SbcCD ATPase subunit